VCVVKQNMMDLSMQNYSLKIANNALKCYTDVTFTATDKYCKNV